MLAAELHFERNANVCIASKLMLLAERVEPILCFPAFMMYLSIRYKGILYHYYIKGFDTGIVVYCEANCVEEMTMP